MSSINPLKLSNPLPPAFLSRKQRKLIQWQSFCILLLSVALVQVALYARSEKQTADLWRAARVSGEAGTASPAVADVATVSDGSEPAAAYYTATLIGKDGSRTALDGKGLEINLGGERLLEVLLGRQEKDRLFMWAPAKRGDDFFNRVIFRPGCANAFEMELERVNLKAGSADMVRYQAP